MMSDDISAPRSVGDLFHSFFFSSRRRHTRSLCDWSSDVCSSDLKQKTTYESLCDWSSDVCSSDLQVVAVFFQVGEEVWAAEHGAPCADHRLHLFKHNPLFPVAFEEELFVDKAAVYDARHHLPVTEHHAHV